jgi:DNA polymerase I-like protein with 3'-5' exonuclease and polymerase domains
MLLQVHDELVFDSQFRTGKKNEGDNQIRNGKCI